MDLWILFVFILLPFVFSFIFAFVIFYTKAFGLGVLLFLCLFSLVSVLLSSFLQVFTCPISKTQSLFFSSYLHSALIEECIKCTIFYFSLLIFVPEARNRKDVYKYNSNVFEKSLFELFMFAMFFASSFSAFENISYFLLETKTLPIRIFTSSFLHILIAPYYLLVLSKHKKYNILLFLIVPILLHGTYNLFMKLGNVFFASIIIIFLILRNIIVLSKQNNHLS